MITPGSVQESPSGSFPSTKGVHNVTKIDLKAISGRSPEAVEFLSCDSSDSVEAALSSDRVSRSDARSQSKRRAHSPTSRRPTFLSVARLFASQFFFPNSFSYGVLANIGSGKVPGQVPGKVSNRFRGRFRAGSEASSDQGGSGPSSGAGFQGSWAVSRDRLVPEQVLGKVPRRFRWVQAGTVPERFENDSVADGGTGSGKGWTSSSSISTSTSTYYYE